MSDTFNLDAELDKLDVSAKPVTLGGETFNVRRDMTGPEIAQYWTHVQAGDDVKALSLLVGEEDGPKLNGVLDTLPQKKMTAAMRKVMELGGLLGEAQGE